MEGRAPRRLVGRSPGTPRPPAEIRASYVKTSLGALPLPGERNFPSGAGGYWALAQESRATAVRAQGLYTGNSSRRSRHRDHSTVRSPGTGRAAGSWSARSRMLHHCVWR